MKKENMTEELTAEYRRVAYYYYKAGLTQEEIANRMQMSRQRVNRIVNACIELGIVEITIKGLDKSNLQMETALEEKYQLREVRIVDSVFDKNIYQELGAAGSAYLQTILKDNDVIGLTRGRTTSALVESIQGSENIENLVVTQLIGNGREEENIGVDEMIYRFAEKFHATPSVLYAPVILKSNEVRDSLVQEPYFKEAYKIVKACTIAVVGIGTAHSQWKHMVSLYDSQDELAYEWTKDVAGEVCTHFFNYEGEEVKPPFRDRIIAITLDDYMKIPVRIGVAGSLEKTEAIRAALKGKYINVLITDLQTAEKLL